MRIEHTRRLAALEMRPKPAPPSAEELAFWQRLGELRVSHASRLALSLLAAWDEAMAGISTQTVAVATVDLMEAIEQADPPAGAALNRLLRSAE